MGAVAAASGTVTEAISTVVTYFKNVSKIQHKPVKSDTDSEDLPPYLQPSESLNKVASRNPVTRAAGYSSQHLANIAYQMASKSLAPNPAMRKKKESKIKSWGPVSKAVEARTTSSRNHALYGHQEEHGRAYEAAHETGHFVDAILGIGLKGTVLGHRTKYQGGMLTLFSPCGILLQYSQRIPQCPLLLVQR